MGIDAVSGASVSGGNFQKMAPFSWKRQEREMILSVSLNQTNKFADPGMTNSFIPKEKRTAAS